MAMIAAIELDDFVAAGEAAGEADGAHAGLGAGTGHAHFLHTGDQRANEPGHGDLERIGNAEAGAVIGGGFHGGDDFGVAMAEDGGAPGEDVVDVVVTIHIPYAAAAGAIDEEGLAADGAKGAHGGIDAAGNVIQRLGEKGFGTGLGHTFSAG